MFNLPDFIPFVNRQVEHHRRRAEKFRDKDPRSFGLNARLADEFEALRICLETAADAPTKPAIIDDGLDDLLKNPTAISQQSIAGLPPELVAQLQVSESDRFNWAVIDLIDKTPGDTIALDVLLIALYKTTGKVYERTDLSNRLYRLGRKDGIYSVPGRKGWYTTVKPPNGEQEPETGDGTE